MKTRRLTVNLSFLLLLTTALIGCAADTSNSNGYDGDDYVGSSNTINSYGTKTKVSTSTKTKTTTSTGTATVSSLPVTGAAAYFSNSMFFNQRIDTAPVDSQSAALIQALANRGGWGLGRMQIDYHIDYYTATTSSVAAPLYDGGVYLPDSDLPPTILMPPSGGTDGFESENGRHCDGGDCHYLVIDPVGRKLTEVDEAEATSNSMTPWGSIAVWDFNKVYSAGLRGDTCTSADASGMPMAPLLFSAEEVAAGAINHAIRFILPNNRIECKTYVRPATHGTGTSNCSGWAVGDGIPYGARLRLRADYPVSSLPTAGARVVAKAMQQYGMILADGGNIALTAKSDAHSTQKWSGLLSAPDLQAIQVSDFQMIDGGSRIHFSSFDCVRNP